LVRVGGVVQVQRLDADAGPPGLNYTPGFLPQRLALEKGYQQILWLLGENVTEAGAMNFLIVLKRSDGGTRPFHPNDVPDADFLLDLDVVTPPLDGTILPGVTRASALDLLTADDAFPGLAHMHAHERPITMPDLVRARADGSLLEAFCVGTAAVVTAVARIGWKGADIDLPPYGGNHIGPVAQALWTRLVDIQEGRVEWKGWSVPCE
jgi:branched-chain amino acid aminotransferase